MTKEDILNEMRKNLVEILPELKEEEIQMTDSMKALGANSMDRFDVLTDTMDTFGIHMPLVKFGDLKNIGEIVDLLYENL